MSLSDKSLSKIGQVFGIDFEPKGIGPYLDEDELTQIREEITKDKDKILRVLNHLEELSEMLNGLGTTSQEMVSWIAEMKTSLEEKVSNTLGDLG